VCNSYLGMVIHSSDELLQLREAIRSILSEQAGFCDLFALLEAHVSYIKPNLCRDRCLAKRIKIREREQLQMGRRLLFQDAINEMGPQLNARFDGTRELYSLRFSDPVRQFQVIWNTASSEDRERIRTEIQCRILTKRIHEIGRINGS